MNVALRRPMTIDAFLDRERRQAPRYEFGGLGFVAMNGVSIEQSDIATNLVRGLVDRSKLPCRAVRGGLKVLPGSHR